MIVPVNTSRRLSALSLSCCLVLLPLLVVGTAACTSTVPAPQNPAAPQPPRHEQWSDAIIYFVIVDRFADGDAANNVSVDPSSPGYFHGGDLVGLREQLDEIADLGVTALWITPVVDNIDDFVTGAGFEDWAYHGYWAEDFARLDPRFGTEAELRALVEACHQRGMAVLLDVVYNHVGYGGGSFVDEADHRAWLRMGGQCGDDDVTSCVGGLPDLKTELPEVAEYLMDAHLGLAGRVGVDGFRLDTVKHVAHPFWQAHRERVQSRLGDDFFLLGEVWGGDPDVLDPWFAGDEMDAGFDFSFAGSVLAWVQGRGRTVAFNRYLERRHRTREGYHLAHYLSSHDVPTALHQLGGDSERFRLATLLQLTTVGIPVLYYGEEVGRRGGEWPDNRSDMPWGDRAVEPGSGLARDEALRADVTRMIAIRRAHPALSRGGYEAVANDGDLLVFARRDPDTSDAVIVAVNRGDEAAEAEAAAPAEWLGKTLEDTWNQRPLEAVGDTLTLRLAPRSALIVVAR